MSDLTLTVMEEAALEFAKALGFLWVRKSPAGVILTEGKNKELGMLCKDNVITECLQESLWVTEEPMCILNFHKEG